MPKLNTANYGAAQERAALKRFLKRKARCNSFIAIAAIIDWIDTRAARASKRKGGLGRK